MGFPEAGSKWYMGGTDGSGQYMVVAEGEYGRVGYREIKPEIYRIRFEPNTDDSVILSAIKSKLMGWCQPQSGIGGETFRFSILGNGKSALRYGVDMAISAMGSHGSFNPAAPEWLRTLIEKPFDPETESVGPALDKGGFWIGKKQVAAGSMLGEWMAGGPGTLKLKNTAFAPDEGSEDECDDECEEENDSDEAEEEEESEDKPAMKATPMDYDHETLMMWMSEDKPIGGYAIWAKGENGRMKLTSAIKNICMSEAKKVGQNWNLSCTCGPCLRAAKTAVSVYEQAKKDYAVKLEAERVRTPEELQQEAITQAAQMAKAASDLAATLKAFGF